MPVEMVPSWGQYYDNLPPEAIKWLYRGIQEEISQETVPVSLVEAAIAEGAVTDPEILGDRRAIARAILAELENQLPYITGLLFREC